MKNVIIVILAVACAVLGYLLFQKSINRENLADSSTVGSQLETPLSSNFLDLEKEAGVLGDEIGQRTATQYCDNWFAYVNNCDDPDDKDLERSVYFSKQEIDDWLSSFQEDNKGIRIYFGRKPGNSTSNPATRDSFTVVLRAMSNFVKIPYSPTGPSVYYNLGGLCPPKCNDRTPQYSDKGIE